MESKLIERIEKQINQTPTGELRNLLTDINIYLHSKKKTQKSLREMTIEAKK